MVISYRTPLLGRGAMLTGFGLMTVGVLFAIVATIFGIGTEDTGGPPVWFLPVVVLVLVFLARIYLVGTAHRLEVEGQSFRWFAPLSRGEAPLHEVRSIRPVAPGAPLATVELSSSRGVMVFAGKGFTAFTRELAVRAPEVDIRLSTYTRVAEHGPGPDGAVL